MNAKRNLSFLLFTIVLSYLTYSSYQKRVYDWDLPGYLGSIFSWDFPNDHEKIHQLTYTTIKAEASKEKYTDIITLNESNKVFEKNPDAFSQQLPYYQIKIGYNLGVYAFYKLGFSAPTSLFIVNFLSYFISGLLIFYFIKRLFPDNYFFTPLISIAILMVPALREMAENPTPDILSFVFLLFFITSLLQSTNRVLPFVFLFCSILIRPDYIVFAVSYILMTLVYQYFSKKKRIDYYLILQMLSFTLLYIFIIKYYNYPGWKAVFYDTFIHRRPIISAESARFTFKQYWDLVVFKFINFKRITLFSSLTLIFIFYLSKDLYIRMLSVLVFMNIYFKFLAFPQGGTLRFFLGFVIVLFLILLYAVSRKNIKTFKLKKIS